jgi:hypothetical protein
MHSAIALAAAGDCQALTRLRRYLARHTDPAFTETAAPLADALTDLIHGDPDRATDTLSGLGDLVCLGGSAAQRDVIEETLLFSATQAGRPELARTLLANRLDRRASPRDHNRLTELDHPSPIQQNPPPRALGVGRS